MIQRVKGLKFLKTEEGHRVLKGFILTMSVLITFMVGYMSIIFYPVMNELEKLPTPKTMHDFIIFLSMLGFVVSALWFSSCELPFLITRPINRKLGWIANNLKPTLPKSFVKPNSREVKE